MQGHNTRGTRVSYRSPFHFVGSSRCRVGFSKGMSFLSFLMVQNPENYLVRKSCKCKREMSLHSTVKSPLLPHVIQITAGSFQPGVEVLHSVSWFGETFDFVGWIELRPRRVAAKVVVDKFIYSNEGEEVHISVESPSKHGDMLTNTGKVERMFYVRRLLRV